MSEREYLAAFNQGKILFDLRKYDEAIQCFDKAISLNPKDSSALFEKARSLHSIGHFEAAIDCYLNVVKLVPDSYMALSNIADILINLGEFEEAIRYADESLEVSRNEFALLNKGVSLHKLGRKEDALSIFKQVITISPGYYLGWFNKGIALASLDRFDEALQCYEEALELNPGYEKAMQEKMRMLKKIQESKN